MLMDELKSLAAFGSPQLVAKPGAADYVQEVVYCLERPFELQPICSQDADTFQ